MNDCIKQKNIDEGKKNLGASMVVEGFPRKIKKLNINVQRLILIIHSGGVAAAFLSSSRHCSTGVVETVANGYC